MDDVEDLIVDLRNVEERLRDLAYERLRAAVEGDEQAKADEKKLLQAGLAEIEEVAALGKHKVGSLQCPRNKR